jgi:hypothetical protein
MVEDVKIDGDTDKDADPEKGGTSGGEMDSEAYDEATKELASKYADAVRSGDEAAAKATLAEIKAKTREAIRPALVSAGVDPASVEEVLDHMDSINDAFKTATDPSEAFANAKAVIDNAPPNVKTGMDKFREVCNNCCSSIREWFGELGKSVGFDSKSHFDVQDENFKEFTDKWNDPSITDSERKQIYDDYIAASEAHGKVLEDGLNQGEAKRKGEEAAGGETNWKKLMSILKVLTIVAGLLALCWQLALMGASNDGCYRFILGDGNTSGTGPIPGSERPSILGRGGGEKDGKCNVKPNINNTITEESCTCGAAAEDGTQAADSTFVSKACTTTSGGAAGVAGEGGAGVGGDAYPYCCQGPPGGVRNPACTGTFGTKGDVYYQWSQTDPSDILANVLNGAESAAKSLGDTAGDIFKGLLKDLGPLKWVLYGIVGLIVFWLCIEIGMAIYKKVQGKEPETVEVMPSTPAG